MGSRSVCGRRPGSASPIPEQPGDFCSSGPTSPLTKTRVLGAATPPYEVEPLLEVETHAFVGAVVPEPLAWAESYGKMFGLAEAFRTPNAAPGEPAIGLAAPDCVLALYPLPEADSLTLWGGEHPRARCHILGLGVPSLDDATKTLAAAGIGIVRRTATSIVVDPAATGEVPLVLVEELLPGDPRK